MSDGVSIDTDKLRELAEAATPGPWALEVGDPHMDGSSTCRLRIEGVPGIRVTLYAMRPDAEFIAAANPAVVLSLLAELDQARTEMERLRAMVGTIYPCSHHDEMEWLNDVGRTVTAARDTAEAENVRLRGVITELRESIETMLWTAQVWTQVDPSLNDFARGYMDARQTVITWAERALAASVSGHQENTE